MVATNDLRLRLFYITILSGVDVIEFKVSGFLELERALRQLPQEVAGRVLMSALRKAGEPMAADAKQAAPRSSNPGPNGHMADSIALRKLRDATSVADVEASLWLGPDPNHWYGTFSEFGTVHETARPFMRPAFDRHKDEAIDLLGKELWKGIARAAKRLAK